MTRLERLLRQANLSPCSRDWSPGVSHLADLGHPARAAELCALAISRGQPLRPLLGKLLLQIGLPDQALEQYYLARPVAVHDCSPAFWLAVELGRPDVAVEFLQPGHLDELEELKESRPDARFARAYLHYRAGNLARAHLEFGKLLDHRQWRIWAQNMRGLCLYHLGLQFVDHAPSCFSRALDHFDQALAWIERGQAEYYCEVYFNRACVHYCRGELSRTLEELQVLRRLDPDYPQLQEWLLEVLRLMKDDEAEGSPQGSSLNPRPPLPSLRFARRPPRR